ncbi:hypothetical protein [Legionella yabuuchiae]|uniref:hypothetical protein n=1 Tax=Legionella yabuuchiae TaxID=376727 RepID=UPI001054A570|nr:hypothetical protein [Legionella yabuuchiae]
MKRISLFLFGFILCATQVYAENQHAHSQKANNLVKKTAKSVNWPGRCEIMIINKSYEPVQVYGIYPSEIKIRKKILKSWI